MPLVARVAIEGHDVHREPVSFRLSRYDAQYNGTLASAPLKALEDDVAQHWVPRLTLSALAGRDADVSWDWPNDVLAPAFKHLRTGEPRGGTLLVLESDRCPCQPEGVARIIYGWDTFHLPRRMLRRGRGPVAPVASYVDTIAVAPWNRVDVPPPPRVRDLGKLLLFASILLSYEDGKDGRVALHAASLAEDWYRQMLPGARFSYDGRELGDERDPDDGNDYGPYIEVDDDAARAYCKHVVGAVPCASAVVPIVPSNVVNALSWFCQGSL